MRPAELGYLFGRVINTDTRIGGFPGDVVLAYIFNPLFPRMELTNFAQLTPSNLLIPPFGINTLPWSRGYFHTVDSRPLLAGDVLAEHVFLESRRTGDFYFDEHGVEVGPSDNAGVWGLRSFRTIDDEISRALGLPLAPNLPSHREPA